ncbi:hypothetical protein [Streptomyces sp. KL116D]
MDNDRPALKKAGYLKRDDRAVRAARRPPVSRRPARPPQYSKR